MCNFSRPFVFAGAIELKVGTNINFLAGANKWTTSATTGTTKVEIQASSPAILSVVIIDGATALALSTLAATFLALFF